MGTGSGEEKSNDRGEQTAKQDLNKSKCTPFVGTNCFGDIAICDCKGIYKQLIGEI